MNHYRLLGGRLRSSLAFPDLPCTPEGEADWVFTVSQSPPPPSQALLGRREVQPGWTLTLSALASGWRFEIGDAGPFDLTADGRCCTWYPGRVRDADLARSVVTGPVLSLALHLRGVLALHGSAVSTTRGVVGFLAPKHHGKSTLALMLTLAGARLVTDDLIAIVPGDPPMVRPGVHHLRFQPDAVDGLPDGLPGTLVRGGKVTLADLPAPWLEESWTPLAALYVLHHPIARGGPCERVRLAPGEALAQVGYNAKLPLELSGLDLGTEVFRRASLVAGSVPVYRLTVPRGLEALPEAADEILSWHQPPAASPASLPRFPDHA